MEYEIERRSFLGDTSLIHREADWAAESLSFRSLVLFNEKTRYSSLQCFSSLVVRNFSLAPRHIIKQRDV